MIELPSHLNYPIVAIGDLHGQRDELESLIKCLETHVPGWDQCALVFLGDFVDRGHDVPGTITLVLELLARPAGGSAVMGNHDLALVRAAELDDRPPSRFWVNRYHTEYDHESTFQGYLKRLPGRGPGDWEPDLAALKDAIPASHREFLSSLPWVVESPGHLFLHCGLSPELQASAEEQLLALHRRQWEKALLRPKPGSNTDRLWKSDYPVWIGADRKLSASPLVYPGKVQVTGHDLVRRPSANSTRIRVDTSAGRGKLTACLILEAEAPPEFISSR